MPKPLRRVFRRSDVTGSELHALIRGLHDARVDFVIVGGLSAVLQGAPITTLDVGIVHDCSPENVMATNSGPSQGGHVFRETRSRLVSHDFSRGLALASLVALVPPEYTLSMDSARREQIEIFRSWSPGQRLEAAARLIDLAVALRDGVGRHGAKAPKGSSRAVRVTDVR